jgi:hypothetical protein
LELQYTAFPIKPDTAYPMLSTLGFTVRNRARGYGESVDGTRVSMIIERPRRVRCREGRIEWCNCKLVQLSEQDVGDVGKTRIEGMGEIFEATEEQGRKHRPGTRARFVGSLLNTKVATTGFNLGKDFCKLS